ncbi:MAG: heme o synthase [Caldilineaceae bacterium]
MLPGDTLVPMFLAGPTAPSALLIFWVMLGGFLAAGGANTINQFVDRDIDHVMVRTRRRPLPSGRMTPAQVLAFGIGLSALSFVQLWLTVNLLTALLALGGILFYVFIYTKLLKRSSTQNIVVGGAAGAIPPLVGWAAVANEISLLPIFLFMIVFYWTPPHFWALALMRKKEYAAAGVPMLPVVAGERATHVQIVLYSVLLFLISLAPFFLGLMGPIYAVAALALNGVFLKQAVGVLRDPSNSHIWRLYKPQPALPGAALPGHGRGQALLPDAGCAGQFQHFVAVLVCAAATDSLSHTGHRYPHDAARRPVAVAVLFGCRAPAVTFWTTAHRERRQHERADH